MQNSFAILVGGVRHQNIINNKVCSNDFRELGIFLERDCRVRHALLHLFLNVSMFWSASCKYALYENSGDKAQPRISRHRLQPLYMNRLQLTLCGTRALGKLT